MGAVWAAALGERGVSERALLLWTLLVLPWGNGRGQLDGIPNLTGPSPQRGLRDATTPEGWVVLLLLWLLLGHTRASIFPVRSGLAVALAPV